MSGCYPLAVVEGGDMAKTSEEQPIKTIEDLIQSQMIEREAIVRLLIKKGIITAEELKAEIDLLKRRIETHRT
jgi:hypothetical protein